MSCCWEEVCGKWIIISLLEMSFFFFNSAWIPVRYFVSLFLPQNFFPVWIQKQVSKLVLPGVSSFNASLFPQHRKNFFLLLYSFYRLRSSFSVCEMLRVFFFLFLQKRVQVLLLQHQSWSSVNQLCFYSALLFYTVLKLLFRTLIHKMIYAMIVYWTW